MNVSAETKRVLRDLGEASVPEIAAAIGIEEGSPRWHNISQAMAQNVGNWSERVSRGRYRYLTNGKPQPRRTTDELRPLVDVLMDSKAMSEALDVVGLNFVGRTQTGALICIDLHGVAWQVELSVTTTLI